jgi:hypothetical protein
MSARKTDEAEIQRIVRAINYVTQEASLMEMTKTWSPADFIYALDRLETDQPTERRAALRGLYRALMIERVELEARQAAEVANERRHGQISVRLQELKKPHWSVVPNFWMTLAVLILTAIGIVLAFRR